MVGEGAGPGGAGLKWEGPGVGARFPSGAVVEGWTWLGLGGRGREPQSLRLPPGPRFLGAPRVPAQVSEGPQADPGPGDYWGREFSFPGGATSSQRGSGCLHMRPRT